MLKEFKDIRVGQLFTVYLGQFVYEKLILKTLVVFSVILYTILTNTCVVRQ